MQTLIKPLSLPIPRFPHASARIRLPHRRQAQPGHGARRERHDQGDHDGSGGRMVRLIRPWAGHCEFNLCTDVFPFAMLQDGDYLSVSMC